MEKMSDVTIISLHEAPEEQALNFNPLTFDDYLGQEELKKKLSLYTNAAKMRNEPLDHMLLFGPPGLGKTTLSQIMAHVMNVGIKICTGPMMERTGDLVAILSSLEKKDILFIDEIHRMPTNVEEVLYSAMEQFRVDVIIGQGAGAQSISLPIAPFTLIGATTKSGKISAPLRSRFGISERIDYYTDDDLQKIVIQNACFLNLALTEDAALIIAQCSRGTPRIAKKLVRRVRDFAQVNCLEHVDEAVTREAMTFLGINHEGLTSVDLMILEKMMLNFNGGPVGLETLASLVGEDADTIEAVYEPFLMRKGYLEKTPRGRQIPQKQIARLVNRFVGQKSIGDE
jgi:Holliday junction DNA helicase RuvB